MDSGLEISPAGPDLQASPWVKRLATGESVYCIPAGAHLAGSAGTNWRTDVEVHNPGSEATAYAMALLLRDADNSSPASRSYVIEPGHSRRFQDVMASEFQLSGAAALRITATSGSLLVSSRTFNDQPGGTYGQFVPAVADAEAFDADSEARLIHLTHHRSMDAGFRTNIGVVNADDDWILVELDLYGAGGDLLDEVLVSLDPYEYVQLDRVFDGVTSADVEDGYAVLTAWPGRFFAWLGG